MYITVTCVTKGYDTRTSVRTYVIYLFYKRSDFNPMICTIFMVLDARFYEKISTSRAHIKHVIATTNIQNSHRQVAAYHLVVRNN